MIDRGPEVFIARSREVRGQKKYKKKTGTIGFDQKPSLKTLMSDIFGKSRLSRDSE